jgi:hypothetical protein
VVELEEGGQPVGRVERVGAELVVERVDEVADQRRRPRDGLVMYLYVAHRLLLGRNTSVTS